MRNLHIGEKFSLPPDAVTSTMVVYGGKGMGKTTFGAVLSEECDRSRLRFCYLDPMGVAWGLRHSADGKGPGIELLVLGGKHGDIPIEPTAGAVVADLVVDEDVNVLIDISRRPDGKMWKKSERIRFVADYIERLYERQGEECRPLLQIIDEAARYVPQIIPHGSPELSRCVGAIESLVEEGRNVGVGVCLLTQRSARMNKSVSELADCMVAFRTIGPKSKAAILDWFGDNVPKERWASLEATIRTVEVGTALVASPGWLRFEGVVRFRPRETFDSSRTPRAGERRQATGAGAKPDLERYAARMAQTIEKAKADDPRALRAEIVQLKGQLANRDRIAETVERARAAPPPAPIEVPAVSEAVRQELLAAAQHGQKIGDAFAAAAERFHEGAHAVARELAKVGSRGPATPRPIDRPVRPPTPMGLARVARPTTPAPAEGDLHIKAGARRMLEVCATFYPGTMTRAQIATAAKVKKTGGTFGTYWSVLTRNGLIADAGGDEFQVTDAGLAYLGADAPRMPETLDERIAFWKARLKEGARRMLDVVREHYGFGVTREELAAALDNMAVNGGTFGTYLSTLRRNRLVEEVDGKLVLHPQLVGGG